MRPASPPIHLQSGVLPDSEAVCGEGVCGEGSSGVFEGDLYLAGGAFVQVTFPGQRDGEADGWTLAGGEDMVECEGGGENEVAFPGDDQFFASFHFPVNFPFEDDPPFVVVVNVVVGFRAGLLADEDATHVIGGSELVDPVGFALSRLMSSRLMWLRASARMGVSSDMDFSSMERNDLNTKTRKRIDP